MYRTYGGYYMITRIDTNKTTTERARERYTKGQMQVMGLIIYHNIINSLTAV